MFAQRSAGRPGLTEVLIAAAIALGTALLLGWLLWGRPLQATRVLAYVCVVYLCVRCVRACLYVYVRACVYAYVRVCACTCACVRVFFVLFCL